MMFNTFNEFITNTPNYARENLYTAIKIKVTPISFTRSTESSNASFVIRSDDSENEYTINVLDVHDQNEPFACSCPSYKYNLHGTCKHIGSLLINNFKIYDTNIIENSSVTREHLSSVWCALCDYIHDILGIPNSEIQLFKEFTLNDEPLEPVKSYRAPFNTPIMRCMTPPRVFRERECPGAPERFARPPTHSAELTSIDRVNSLVDKAIELVVADILSRENNINQMIAEKMSKLIKNMYSSNM
jgi:hypothetical protein